MKFGDGAQDATQPGPGDAAAAGTAGGDGDGKPARSLRTQESLQDIMDISTSSRRLPSSYARHTPARPACRTRRHSQPGALASQAR